MRQKANDKPKQSNTVWILMMYWEVKRGCNKRYEIHHSLTWVHKLFKNLYKSSENYHITKEAARRTPPQGNCITDINHISRQKSNRYRGLKEKWRLRNCQPSPTKLFAPDVWTYRHQVYPLCLTYWSYICNGRQHQPAQEDSCFTSSTFPDSEFFA